MKLKLTKEMIELATHHQNRSYYFEKFETLVRTTYPEWKNISKNEIYKKFDLIYKRKEQIEDLNHERDICIKLMKEQVIVNTFDRELNKKQSKRNYEYWAIEIDKLDKQLTKLGYSPSKYPSYDSLNTSNNIKNIVLISSIIGFAIAILFIIF
jgi:transcription-repair coupling factor (superfamily II helicase)